MKMMMVTTEMSGFRMGLCGLERMVHELCCLVSNCQ